MNTLQIDQYEQLTFDLFENLGIFIDQEILSKAIETANTILFGHGSSNTAKFYSIKSSSEQKISKVRFE